MLWFLDPYTSLYQTDDDREGRSLASEPGFWPVSRVEDGFSKEGTPFTNPGNPIGLTMQQWI